jgi:hypothetical protein
MLVTARHHHHHHHHHHRRRRRRRRRPALFYPRLIARVGGPEVDAQCAGDRRVAYKKRGHF